MIQHLALSANIFSSIGKPISQIFHPLLTLFGTVLAAIYGVLPNYAIAISVLTLIIMGALTPLTIKATRSQIAMQRIQPEMKRLQLKYKGSTDRQAMNEEMMALYKEYGVNPLSGCLPVLAQAPFMIVLYSVIRGLTNTVPSKVPGGLPTAEPKFIPVSSEMYHNLVASHGAMMSFGMNLSLHPFSPGLTFIQRIPYFVLIGLAVGLQYVLMWQIKKNMNQGNTVPQQMQTVQRLMPLIFAYIYFIVPAALAVYFVVSNVVRVITQDLMFRTGAVRRPTKPTERMIPGTAKEKPEASADAPSAKKGKPAIEPAEGASKAHPRSKDKKKRKDR